jgi:ElaB/YqjD/DUF883 family membrane-anchored ribosome-binding protein
MDTDTERRKHTGNGNASPRERVEEKMEAIQERWGQAKTNLIRFVRERPGTAIALAAGCGYLLGKIVRR